ncbi:MAG: Na+/H+ antiporter NhaA [Segetibacter sp.]|nr:Na+/H+ antiporter NhaA [Segetibacter sp.]
MFGVLKRSFVNPLLEFFNDSRSIGIVLLACTCISLVITNISAGNGYTDLWQTELPFINDLYLPHSLLHWINDGLMAVFFFLVGMEIKRELVEGELSSVRKALLPVVGALGGMLFPALIYVLFTKNTTFTGGWGVPTATDIAFSLGIASLLRKRVPVALKVFLTALAIIDDLGAILVIALFYGGAIKIVFLIATAVIAAVILLLNYLKLKFGILQIALGLVLWFCMYNSGIHATIAGVIFAFLVPTQLLSNYENKLHHLVYFLIMPVFALANTAIIIPSAGLAVLNSAMPWGIMAGLFIGKPVGILTATFILVRLKKGDLPEQTNWGQMAGAGILAGIGFTMSIFISTLAFTDASARDIAKIAVLAASFLSMIVGFTWLRFSKN